MELSVTRIGNSKGIRLPAEVLRRYKVRDVLLMEQRPDEIALRPKRGPRTKLSWAETYRQMAQSTRTGQIGRRLAKDYAMSKSLFFATFIRSDFYSVLGKANAT